MYDLTLHLRLVCGSAKEFQVANEVAVGSMKESEVNHAAERNGASNTADGFSKKVLVGRNNHASQFQRAVEQTGSGVLRR